MDKKAYLVLENGKVFEGEAAGYESECVGELVFTTAMTGYIETLTDPSYYGQIVLQTFPLIGNYGIIPEDFESRKPFLSGYVVRDICEHPSNFRCKGKLRDFLIENKIPAISGIDTRALTKIIRENGVLNAKISFDGKIPADLKDYKIVNAVKSVTEGHGIREIGGDGIKVIVWDFGVKGNIERELIKRGCNVFTASAYSTAEEILAENPAALVLSNGPGDPAENTDIIEEIKKLLEKRLPMLGICLGHQLLALANGAETKKIKYGHRGANQPALYKKTGKVFVTSQNHGYAVAGETLPPFAKESFVNGNDGTCEGIDYQDRPAFSVQFHPEASAGPHDTSFLFDEFLNLVKGGCR